MDIIESTGFDIIGGVAGLPLDIGLGKGWANDWLNHGKYHVKQGNIGYCLHRDYGYYGLGFQHFNAKLKWDTVNASFLIVELVRIPPRSLPGFEKCHATDIVQNFFIARTLTAGTIRFDGLFKRIAHREYFLDAIGKLRIAIW